MFEQRVMLNPHVTRPSTFIISLIQRVGGGFSLLLMINTSNKVRNLSLFSNKCETDQSVNFINIL